MDDDNCQGSNNSLEDLVQQLKKSFSTNFDSNDTNNRINSCNNEQIDIISYLSSQIPNHNSEKCFDNLSKIALENLPESNSIDINKWRKKYKVATFSFKLSLN